MALLKFLISMSALPFVRAKCAPCATLIYPERARLGIVGESGAANPSPLFTAELDAKPGFCRSIKSEGKEPNRMSERGLRKVRGNRISMIVKIR